MIECRDVVYRFGDTVAVDGVSLRIPEGSVLVLAGRNGSGKTTLVRHFNALLAPDEGTVTVDGVAATEDPVRARTTVGMVFQHPADQFVAPTVGADVAFGPENLGLPREVIEERVDAALATVDLADRGDARIEDLSGGVQARVAIAGALAMDPDYLVLDEPFASVDHPARESILARLDELHAGGTGIVVVTHDLRDLRDRADRVVGLRDGRVAVDTATGDGVTALEGIGVHVPEC